MATTRGLYASAQHVLRLSYYGGDLMVSEATADERKMLDNNNARLIPMVALPN